MWNHNEETQRMLNIRKREYLAEKFGARFPAARREIEPEGEAKMLDQVAEIEAACAIGGEVTVREYLGNPHFKPALDVPPGELKSELERIENLIQNNNIIFVTPEEMTHFEKYRVLVNGLLDQKIENVRFPIWYAVFMYIPFLGFKRIGVSMNQVGPINPR